MSRHCRRRPRRPARNDEAFLLAPLLYDVGVLATAGTQLAGLLVASFAGYATVAWLA